MPTKRQARVSRGFFIVFLFLAGVQQSTHVHQHGGERPAGYAEDFFVFM
jgi:hypothetical protein